MQQSRTILPCVDCRWIAQSFAYRRSVTRPERLGKSWLLPGHAFGSVLRDSDGQWRMWYLNEPIYCEYYATSRDGLTWDRPELGLELRGADGGLLEGNAFLVSPQQDRFGRWLAHTAGPEGFCVLDNEQTAHPGAQSRYTALYLAGIEKAGQVESGLCIVHSDDGIHWRSDEHNPVIGGWHDTMNMFFYDSRINRYVLYGRPDSYVDRVTHANRLIGRCESEDLIHWTPYQTVLDTDDLDADPMEMIDEAMLRAGGTLTAAQRAAAWQSITEGSVSDTKAMIRGRNRQWYGITVIPYERLYLGFGMMYDVASGHIWLELIHSYDGVEWRREAGREPWLGMEAGTWDYPMQVPFSSPPVPVGDEVWFYYGGDSRIHHGGQAVSGEQPKVGIGARKLLRDRWVGYIADKREGELLSEVITGGDELTLNAKIAPHGALRVELCDVRGGALPGFELSSCRPISGNGLDLPVRWSEKRLGDCGRKHLRLRVIGHEATLYAVNICSGGGGQTQ